MRAIVFVGPTLPGLQAGEIGPDMVVAPPAKRGDIYVACKSRPDAIGLIDGYFDHRMSVWHKEILWALAHGIRVYGAASMGALRAAELDVFGMIGVGQVYESFSSGKLEDDDEVAIVHDPADNGYTPRSDAMVNLRATFAAAVRAGALRAEEATALVATGKALFYADRSVHDVLEGTHGMADDRKRALTEWIREHGIVDQKRSDAFALIDRTARDQHGTASTASFRMAETNYWNVMRQELDRQSMPHRSQGNAPGRRTPLTKA